MSEAWLRGPLAGVPAEIMPAAHALTDAAEEIRAALAGLSPDVLWLRPGGAASLGFHVRHVAGSLDRLLTYARGDALSTAQLAELAREAEPGDPPDDWERLVAVLDHAVARALDVYRTTSPETLADARAVGRAGLPSTVRGLLFHAAEHARRHAGQVIATARIVRGLGLDAHLPRSTS
jgi:uncharacterized damage-inducible protein DinB